MKMTKESFGGKFVVRLCNGYWYPVHSGRSVCWAIQVTSCRFRQHLVLVEKTMGALLVLTGILFLADEKNIEVC